MTALKKKVEKCILKEYNISTVAELKSVIVEAEYQKIIDRYVDEVKLRIVRQKQDDAKNYKPTDEEIIERLQAKIDVAKYSKE
jgi:hypothetical protein